MSNIMTLPAWVDRTQAEITETDWKWRQLDEQEWHRWASGAQSTTLRAKRALEEDAGRLRAELAVARFLDTFRDGPLAAHLGTHDWSDSLVNRLGLAMLVQAGAERTALPDVEICWRHVTSAHKPRTDEWWVEVEAVYQWHGEPLARQTYRFHVVDFRVEGWTARLEAGTADGPDSSGRRMKLSRPLRMLMDAPGRLMRPR
jgi:hypothetical protein